MFRLAKVIVIGALNLYPGFVFTGQRLIQTIGVRRRTGIVRAVAKYQGRYRNVCGAGIPSALDLS